MIRPCDIILTGCPGVDSPITNLSAEAPDPFLWAGVGYDIYNPYQPHPLGDGLYTATDCYGVAWSATSQAEADFLANQYVILCTQGVAFPPLPPLVLDPGGAGFPTFPGLPPGIAWTPPVFVPPPPPGSQVFANTAQTATASCPNGAVFSYTVAAGLLQSAPINPELGPVMVELLNAEALAYALATVWSLRACIDLPLLDLRVPPGTPAPADWPPGVDWPVVNPDPNTPPPNWPGGRTWPPPSSRGPTVAANPGWICLGQDLDPDLNLYNVTGSGSYTFSIDGDVPPGTDLVTTGNLSAQLEGTPAAPGEYTYTVHAQNSSNPSLAVQVTDTLKVFGMTTTSLPDGTVGTLYGPVQLQTAGGTDPVTFTLVGSLPDGLSLSADGIISGTPTTAGTSTFTVKFTDAENGTCQQDLEILVSGGCTPLDWTQLVWHQTGGIGVGNFSGDHWDTQDDAPCWFLTTGQVYGIMDGSGCEQSGELVGSDSWSYVGGANPKSYNVSIYLNLVLVFSHDYTAGITEHIVPFTIPAGPGQIQVYVTWQNCATGLSIGNTP